MHQPFGMHPAQRMLTDGKLAGAVADDHRIAQKAMRLDAAPQRRLGGDLGRIRGEAQRRNPAPFEMRLPRGGIGEPVVGMLGEAGGHRPGERP